MMTRLIIVAILTVGLLCTGCASEQDREAERVIATVRAYNEALIRAFASLDMNELNSVATEDQAWREYNLMAALGEGRVRMLATLVEAEFGEPAFPAEGQATVVATEVWDYDHESLDTSDTVRSERGVAYSLRYDLILQDDQWLVDRVTDLSE